MALEKFDVVLKRIRRISPTTLDFRFERCDGRPVDFVPGQFFRFTFRDERGEFERSYSLCNFEKPVEGRSWLDLVISRVEGGRATDYLFHCNEGIRASAQGPFGKLVLPAELPKRLFLVATSVGIAPFLSMLDSISRVIDESGIEVIVLFGVRDRSEFLYREMLTAFDAEHPRFTLRVCYSRLRDVDLQPCEQTGYVTVALENYHPDPGTDHFLLCGNPEMIDDAYAMLRAAGFRAKQVTREKYVFAREAKQVRKRPLTDEEKRLIAEKMNQYRQE